MKYSEMHKEAYFLSLEAFLHVHVHFHHLSIYNIYWHLSTLQYECKSLLCDLDLPKLYNTTWLTHHKNSSDVIKA